MKTLTSCLLGALLAPALVTHLGAADLGMTAPPLQIREWIKGGPVKLAEGVGKQVYVVEFWATWCPPCRTSIPHLTALQKKFKDRGLVVIGISNEVADKVKPFVEKMGDQMDYVVAVDQDNQTGDAYMKAFGQGGIPHSFVVDKEGRIVWHGHPMAGLDNTVEQVLAGKFDIEAARKAQNAADELHGYFEKVSAASLDPGAAAMGERIVRDAGGSAATLNEFAWTILTHPRVKHRDLPLALRAAQTAYEVSKGKEASITDTYARALFDTGKPAEAIRLQKEAIAVCEDASLRPQLEKALKAYEAKAKGGGGVQ